MKKKSITEVSDEEKAEIVEYWKTNRNNTMPDLSRVFNTTSLGASGAVIGVLAAFAFLYPNKQVILLFPPIPIKLKYIAVGMIGGDFVSGFLTGTPLLANSNVGYFAHVGGALTALLIIWYWKKNAV